MMTKLRKRMVESAGFTLVELIVVIAVLGILAGIAIPRLTGVQDKAELETLNANARTVRNALETYYASEGEYPDSIDDLTTEDDISIDLPDDLDIEDDDLETDTYTVELEGDYYTVTATPGGISDEEK